MEHFTGQTIPDSGDRADRPTTKKSMHNLSIDSDHQQRTALIVSDMLGSITE